MPSNVINLFEIDFPNECEYTQTHKMNLNSTFKHIMRHYIYAQAHTITHLEIQIRTCGYWENVAANVL